MRIKPKNRFAAHPSGARAEPFHQSLPQHVRDLNLGKLLYRCKTALTAACIMPRSGGDCSPKTSQMPTHHRFVGDVPF